MVSSMTGYGIAEAKGDGHIITVEIKSVNSRYCEVKTKTPRKLAMFEEKITRKMKEKFDRGNFEVYLRYTVLEPGEKVMKVDKELALAYYDKLKDLSESMGEKVPISPIDIINLPEVLVPNDEVDDVKALWLLTKMALYDAIKRVKSMRLDEGFNLKKDVLNHIERLQEISQTVKSYSEDNLVEYRNRMLERIGAILDDVPINEDRLATEVAIYADKSDITEEIVRLESHCQLMYDTLENEDILGRKLDFLVQEMNREVNTIGSKSHFTQISQAVVEMKSEIEKMREQIQNME